MGKEERIQDLDNFYNKHYVFTFKDVVIGKMTKDMHTFNEIITIDKFNISLLNNNFGYKEKLIQTLSKRMIESMIERFNQDDEFEIDCPYIPLEYKSYITIDDFKNNDTNFIMTQYVNAEDMISHVDLYFLIPYSGVYKIEWNLIMKYQENVMISVFGSDSLRLMFEFIDKKFNTLLTPFEWHPEKDLSDKICKLLLAETKDRDEALKFIVSGFNKYVEKLN